MSIDFPMLLAPLAQLFPGYSAGQIAAAVVVVGAIVAIVIVALRWLKVPIPEPAWQILGIVGIAVFVLFMIGVLMRFAGWA